MGEKDIDKMALDLGIIPFQDESFIGYKSRVVYSAMSCWIKAIAMDQPVGNREAGFVGVSRRHVYERSRGVLENICKIHPELSFWFNISEIEHHPVNLIRTRLLKHGDLRNEGFNTNIALSNSYSMQLSTGVETLYGELLGDDIEYVGVATIRRNSIVNPVENVIKIHEWLEEFLKEAWWSKEFPNTSKWEYFNPASQAKTNYDAWQNNLPNDVRGIILARSSVNKFDYEYYLVKPKIKLLHKLDPFLQNQGYHKRLMYALRDSINNSSEATIKVYDSHVYLRLNAHLPEKENFLLESYAWPLRHVNDISAWVMTPVIWDFVEPFIESLGIRIKENKDG